MAETSRMALLSTLKSCSVDSNKSHSPKQEFEVERLWKLHVQIRGYFREPGQTLDRHSVTGIRDLSVSHMKGAS